MANRHDVIIWDAEDSLITDDIVALIDRVYEAAEDYRSPTPRLLQLATVLEKKLQSYVNQEEKDDNYYVADYVINQIRQDNHTIPAALCLEMSSSNWKQVLYMLIQAATQCHLVVVDTENFLALLPDGSFLPDRAEYLWQDIVDDVETARLKALDSTTPQTIEQYVKWCLDFYTPFFAKHGFEPYELGQPYLMDSEQYYSWYYRKTAMGTHNLIINHSIYKKDHREEDFQFQDRINLYIDSDIIRHIVNLHHNIMAMSDCCFGFDSKEQEKIRDTSLGLNRLQLCQTFLETYVIPLSQQLNSIHRLDEAMNCYEKDKKWWQGTNASATPIVRLIVSRLANNPRFEDLAEKIKSDPYAVEKKYLDNRFNYLTEELNPEHFWQHYPQLAQEEARLRDLDLNALEAKYSPKSREELLYLDSLWHDEAHNLIWQKCCLGQTWQAGKVIGSPLKLSWDEVLKILADKQNIEQGWRIPTSEEFRTLYIPQKVAYFTQSGISHYETPLLHPDVWICNLPLPINLDIDFYKQELAYFKKNRHALRQFKNKSDVAVVSKGLEYIDNHYKATFFAQPFLYDGFKLKGAVLLVKSMS